MRWPLLTAVLVATAVALAPAGDDEMVNADEQHLRDAKVATDSPGLLEFFRKRTLSEEQRRQVMALIGTLDSRQFHERQEASEKLEAFGPSALPFLHAAAVGNGLEMTRRVERCIEAIERVRSPEVPAIAARVLKARKPDQAAAVLLAYVPYADDPAVEAEVLDALTALAVRDGKLVPEVLAGLKDALPPRRAAAAFVAARAGTADERQAVVALLSDKEPRVRLRAAQGLLHAGAREAVPTLVALLREAPAPVAQQAEDLLARVARDKAPAPSLHNDRQRCRDLWAAWGRDHGKTADITKLGDLRSPLGYTVVAQYGSGTGAGDRVVELDSQGRIRWEIQNLNYPVDVQNLPNGRVLVVEHSANRVTERTSRGNIVWQKALANKPRGPYAAQRLANGNTFIVMHAELVEVDPAGKEVWTRKADDYQYLGAHKTADGLIVFLTSEGDCIRLDAEGKEVNKFKSEHATHWTAGIDVLPNGRVLVPQHGLNKVVEFDAHGKAMWEAKITAPKTATRLPNGHTLVSSFETTTVVELDRAGKPVWEYKDTFAQYRARRR